MSKEIKAKAELLCKKFINKVETGKALSKETYADCKELLAAIESEDKSDDPILEIQQIAIAADDPQQLMENLAGALGLTKWAHDEVTATGIVFGKPTTNVAELHFNYQLGFELEILKYQKGENWHMKRNADNASTFQSHMGLHVNKEKMESIKSTLLNFGIKIAQEVWTDKHTNHHIAGKRKYHYVVFDSLDYFGFDLKLIERIMI
jgi:hypothetical protein